MSLLQRFHVTENGAGKPTFIFAHGFGCDQSMWRYVAPHYARGHRVLCYDLAGCGRSDRSAYDRDRHGRLQGHADDLVDILRYTGAGPVVFVGHSVSAMIGLLAGIRHPELFAVQIWLAASPCYVNDGTYAGGFGRAEIESLLEMMDRDFLGWSSTLAPTVMGAPDRPELGEELTHSFRRTEPDIARHFARVTFLSDHRADVPRLQVPTLVLQCSDDPMVPQGVADYLRRTLRRGTVRSVDNVGHYPHLSAPTQILHAMDAYLAEHNDALAPA